MESVVNLVCKHHKRNFFSSQNVSEAKDYFKRKIEFVGKQMEKIQPTLVEKQRIRQGEIIRYRTVDLTCV